ncbi:hypothetical protein CROQUDRAFT_38069 [Cronartium quercuum f. sp. fusiforme G11]|uniref:Uncharacterized protein n=1 Tax=Cronartium quercuum f. sp. fusiforme G11 TaxID=708437 RepID=A0A9P6NNV4_9BASI|nr:hypothetical protein CROQUDRAFT_38069 [Cronartium quercuum f. sp. fusiforme G11]
MGLILKRFDFFLFWIMILNWVPLTLSNWDEATGHLHDYKPTLEWRSKNFLQLFATFQVNHKDDGYHGCPYGQCCAYTVIPNPEDMISDFTDWHVFFWHNLGGLPGPGTNPISDPQTGQWGYETSDGKFHLGLPDYSEREQGHDSNYPNFELPSPWPENLIPISLSKQPFHPKCGIKNGPNCDPGQILGKGTYVPAPASSYSPPEHSKLV